MKNIKPAILYLVITSLCFSEISLMSCKRSMYGMIIITRAVINSGNPDYTTDDLCRYTGQTQLAAINPQSPEKSPLLLTESFFSACSPDISYDGKMMLFTGRLKEDDPWQIWEMSLDNLKARQITSSPENSTDPAYLPGERVVFSRSAINDSLKSGQILFTANLDGTDQRRITFNPHAYYSPSVLKDGRIITVSRQMYPVQKKASMMVLRPDGTKSELFYKTSEGDELFSRGRETINGKIIFIESPDSSKSGGSIVSISYSRPLHSRVNLTTSVPGDFHSAFPLQSGKLMVSYRSSFDEKYAIFEFDPEEKVLGNIVHKSTEYDILDAVVVKEHTRPKKLPSEVDMGVKTGLLLCQNINVTAMQSMGNKISFPGADRIEIVGIDSSLGVVEVEEDGSFYLKVAADMPFRIKTMDANGFVINGPGSWLWLRPNERRGCTGCHEDHESVPANRYALAVKNNPVSIPVNIIGVKEKKVELE